MNDDTAAETEPDRSRTTHDVLRELAEEMECRDDPVLVADLTAGQQSALEAIAGTSAVAAVDEAHRALAAGEVEPPG